MTNAPELLLAHHLKTLKLPTFLREYDKLARQCAAEGLDHVRFLARLVELELIDRERRMIERRIKAANGSTGARTLSHWGRAAPVKRMLPWGSVSLLARRASPSASSPPRPWCTN